MHTLRREAGVPFLDLVTLRDFYQFLGMMADTLSVRSRCY